PVEHHEVLRVEHDAGRIAIGETDDALASKHGLRHQLPSKRGFCFAAKALYARVKSSVSMQIAWACASASIAWSMLMFHSWCSIVLVMPLANVGPWTSSRASACASAR